VESGWQEKRRGLFEKRGWDFRTMQKRREEGDLVRRID